MMDNEIWAQYKKTFLELQYGMSAGGAYPAACLLSAFSASIGYEFSEAVQWTGDLKPYGVHAGQLLERINIQISIPPWGKTFKATENERLEYERRSAEYRSFAAPSRQILAQENLAMLDLASVEGRLGISEETAREFRDTYFEKTTEDGREEYVPRQQPQRRFRRNGGPTCEIVVKR